MKGTISAIAVVLPVLIVLAAGTAVHAAGTADIFLEKKIPEAGGEVTALAFSPDGGRIAFGNSRGGSTLLDVETGETGALFEPAGKGIVAIEFSGGGRYLAAASLDGRVLIVDLEAGSAPIEVMRSRGRISVLGFSGDERYLAGGGDKKEILVWEVSSGQLRSRLKGHNGGILELAFNPVEGTLVSIGADNCMMVWDIASMTQLRRHELEARTVGNSGVDITCAAVSSDRSFVVAGIDEHVLEKGGRKMLFKYNLAFFDLSKGVLLKTLEENRSRIDRLALYPGNCYVALDNSTLQENAIALRNIETGSFDVKYPLDGKCGPLAFSPDGSRLAAAVKPESGGSYLGVWRVEYTAPASGCFMGRIRLTSAGKPVIEAGPQRVAAVIPFETGGIDAEAGRAAAHFLENALISSPYLRFVERSRIADILAELKLQSSDFADRKRAVEIGKLLGASYIITGNIDRTGPDIVVAARVISAETGEILGIKEVHCAQCGADDIYDAVDILAKALAAP